VQDTHSILDVNDNCDTRTGFRVELTNLAYMFEYVTAEVCLDE
jgi:hypothetical protein